jgi:hypothetical protein
MIFVYTGTGTGDSSLNTEPETFLRNPIQDRTS